MKKLGSWKVCNNKKWAAGRQVSLCWELLLLHPEKCCTISATVAGHPFKQHNAFLVMPTYVFEVCYRGVDLQQEVVLPNLCRQGQMHSNGQQQTVD
jgi:hypothetical protein